MLYTHLTVLSENEKVQIRTLWNRVYPEAICLESDADFEQYLTTLKMAKHTLGVDEKGEVVVWYCDFDRDDDRWFLLMIDSEYQHRGIGSELLTEAQKANDCLFGWAVENHDLVKADGSVYQSPLGFYAKSGFTILKNERFESDVMTTVKIRWEKR